MKPLLLLLLTLLLKVPAGAPPKVRVTFSPLTKAAYLAAAKAAVVTKPVLTFPLKKVRGRIVIPTNSGPKVFKDNPVAEDDPDWEKYTYRGYSPQLECHLIEHSHYEWIGEILLDKSGRQTEIFSMPFYSPDLRSFVTISAGIGYSVFPNEISLSQFEKGHWREVWKLEPSVEPATWEPEEIKWLSNSTLLLKKKMWTGKSPGTTFTYAKLTIL
ncbi:hypothetical protein [Hymenobacter negativus]|uniref:Uncharacterized protein n=1 Tax=Hymenobacter negativus TaxID=2795026 RepID=A0ABS0Q713_9BACT|nr:hypothetical protein [Hymenobacter negativus]MBH8558439.1 hypothetical protein [Hymenobacter negativus]